MHELYITVQHVTRIILRLRFLEAHQITSNNKLTLPITALLLVDLFLTDTYFPTASSSPVSMQQ